MKNKNWIVNLFVAGGGAILAFVSYYFLRHSEGWHLDLKNGVALGSALGGLALFSTLRMSFAARINALGVLFTVFFSLYVLEALVPWVDSFKLRYAQIQRREQAAVQSQLVAKNYDRRNKLQVVRDMRQQGIKAYPTIHPGAFVARAGMTPTFRSEGREVFPLSGIANEISVFCNEGGQYTIYHSDEHGFHNPTGLYQKGKVDVALIGDSIVEGACVPPDADIAGWIRRQAPMTLNFGMYGIGPIIELAEFREYVEPTQPKNILWFFLDSDMGDIEVEKFDSFLTRYFNPSFNQGLYARQSEMDHLLKDYAESEMTRRAGEKAAVDVFAQMAAEDPGRDLSQPWKERVRAFLVLAKLREHVGLLFSPNLEILKRTLALADKTAKSWGGQLYLVYVPDEEIVARRDLGARFKGSVERLTRNLGIPFIDVDAAVQAHPDPLSLFPFRGRRHFNEEGYHLVADTVLKRLESDGRIPVSRNHLGQR